MSEIHNDAFQPLTNIVELSLSANFLQHVPKRALANLAKLKNLDLSKNTINKLNNGDFESLKSLKVLSLEG